MIEILVVVTIIAILVGLLLPAVHTVQKMARDTKQKAQLTAIELGLAAFKNDYGDYPPSFCWDPGVSTSGTLRDYCGAQKLAEAMLGWDLRGFHPDSAWRSDGLDENKTASTVYWDTSEAGLQKRRGRYIDVDNANPFMLSGTYGLFPGVLAQLSDRYVLCDVFPVSERKIQLSDGKTVSPGTPILYYRANAANLLHKPDLLENTRLGIYNPRDNAWLVALGRLADLNKTSPDPHWLAADALQDRGMSGFDYFYEYTRDPRVTAASWPYRPDSYLLISAGMDGYYGTNDDIRNFGQ